MRDTSHLTPQDRAENGLPEEGVVFGCLANPYKFSQKILAAWAEILKAVPDGVLLLGVMAPDALRGVQDSLERLGVARSRVIQSVFQPTRDEHFARLKMVDVFLDTYPYNAHSLAADAVSAGVPLVTLVGNSFASRVAGSLNAFLGTSELNAYYPSEYIANAVALAKDAQRRSVLRVQLLQRVSEISWGSAYAADFEEKILINEVHPRA
jgi:predicted O-linked N-acetylglucosamine transferase (SPINDLY family)